MILVSIDSLRGDHCGHLDDSWDLTPTMDGLAESGVAYENAIAPGPQTFSSMPTVFTGTFRQAGPLDEYSGDSHWQRRLAAIDDHVSSVPFLPQQLKRQGYTTAAVSPNPWTSTATGFDRGFDQFVDLSGDGPNGWFETVVDKIPGVNANGRGMELIADLFGGTSFFSRWESLYDDLRAVREQLEEPYFLWVFILDTHFPFLASRAHRKEQSLLSMYYTAYRGERTMRGRDRSHALSDGLRRKLQQSYRETVRASDAFLAQLQADFRDDDPVTIVHSDHGESFGEHGNYGHHHRDVYSENVHVPYLVHNAGVSDSISEPVSLASIYDVVRTLAREGSFDPRDVTSEHVFTRSECGTRQAIQTEGFKYLESGDERHLFDLEHDSEERTDLSNRRPTLTEQLNSRLQRSGTHCDEVRNISRATGVVASAGVL